MKALEGLLYNCRKAIYSDGWWYEPVTFFFSMFFFLLSKYKVIPHLVHQQQSIYVPCTYRLYAHIYDSRFALQVLERIITLALRTCQCFYIPKPWNKVPRRLNGSRFYMKQIRNKSSAKWNHWVWRVLAVNEYSLLQYRMVYAIRRYRMVVWYMKNPSFILITTLR